MRRIVLIIIICFGLLASAREMTAQEATTTSPMPRDTQATRILSGVVMTARYEVVVGASVIVSSASARQSTSSDAGGRFRLAVPREQAMLRIEGKNIVPVEMPLGADDTVANLEIKIEYSIPPIHESVVIEDSTLEPSADRRDNTIYRDSLFSRDDQVFHTLNAGVNAGQHEGGGKSLEIRRFGFNLDHGGVNGGLKVLVDDVQQNQGTQGHGQGYLGQLKSLTPELVQDVKILNGPFSAQYGDFSGLGVVHVRLRESLPDQLTLRVQGGSFDTFRTFVAYSPALASANAFIAYEGSRSDGPFISPLRYRRDNVTGNYTRRLDEHRSLGFKLNLSRNKFFSSGQIPLDEVAAGRLDRFGFIDPDNGGRVQTGLAGVYYQHEFAGGASLKADGFVSRSLFDLFSNFTFFLNDPVNGDEVQQHDSRLQQGANLQYLRPLKIFGQPSLFIAGGNFHANQINVGLYRSTARAPFDIDTDAHARVTNFAGYVQQSIDLLDGHLHLQGGLRYDYFRFTVEDKVDAAFSGSQAGARVQPKASVAFMLSDRFPAIIHFNYGRGISSQDARGVVRDPSGNKISTTDFYQFGTSYNNRRFSFAGDLFLIDRSNEQVYIPDDGTIELADPSRAYGYELKTAFQMSRHLSFDGGLTQVMNAFYRATSPRRYVDSAPHTVANAGFTLAGYRGFTGSLRYRHVGNYRLDGEDASLRAAGLDVLDLSITKRLRRQLDFNFSIDNLTNKRYFETQNYFESRLEPDAGVVPRIHATPGYPLTVTVGLTFRLWGKG